MDDSTQPNHHSSDITTWDHCDPSRYSPWYSFYDPVLVKSPHIRNSIMPNETISIYNTTISPFTIQVPPFTAPIRRPFLSTRSAAPGHCVSRHPGHALPHGQCLWPPGGGNSVMDPWRYRGTLLDWNGRRILYLGSVKRRETLTWWGKILKMESDFSQSKFDGSALIIFWFK